MKKNENVNLLILGSRTDPSFVTTLNSYGLQLTPTQVHRSQWTKRAIYIFFCNSKFWFLIILFSGSIELLFHSIFLLVIFNVTNTIVTYLICYRNLLIFNCIPLFFVFVAFNLHTFLPVKKISEVISEYGDVVIDSGFCNIVHFSNVHFLSYSYFHQKMKTLD